MDTFRSNPQRVTYTKRSVEHYAGIVPESLDNLSSEERHQIYKMLRIEVLAYPDKSLEVSGSLVGGRGWRDGA